MKKGVLHPQWESTWQTWAVRGKLRGQGTAPFVCLLGCVRQCPAKQGLKRPKLSVRLLHIRDLGKVGFLSDRGSRVATTDACPISVFHVACWDKMLLVTIIRCHPREGNQSRAFPSESSPQRIHLRPHLPQLPKGCSGFHHWGGNPILPF